MEVSFYLKRPKATEPTAIFARISYFSNQLKYYPSLKIHPNNWNKDTQKARQTLDGYGSFNQRLKDIVSDVEDILRDYQNNNDSRIPTTEELKELIDLRLKDTTPSKEKLTFMSFFQKVIDDSTKGLRLNLKSEKPITKGTTKNYTGTRNTLTDFITKTRKKVDFENINLDFYADFTTYLQQEKKSSLNTIGKHIKIIKTIMNEATDAEINTNTAFKSRRFKAVQEKVEDIYLTETELNAIAKLKLNEEPKLDRVRDMFLIGCYTGLRFSDFSVLKPENIKDGFIETTQIKTGDAVVIPVHDRVAAILKKYKGVLPPAISNQKMNDYIKDVVKKVDGFKTRVPVASTQGGQRMTTNIEKFKMVSTHTARRSFATNEFKAGTPTLTIMAITGHKTEAAFLKYIKVNPREHAQILKLEWQKRAKSKKGRLIKLSA